MKKNILKMLNQEVNVRDNSYELSYDKPDPLLIARRYRDESIALICALFAYGNAKQIVKFLDSLDFSLLDRSTKEIEDSLAKHYYRFQKSEDIIALFIALKRVKEIDTIENIFYEGYKKEHNILDGLWSFITKLKEVNSYNSRGYSFLVGSVPKKKGSIGTYKRYMMFLRWMVREDSLDMGLWSKINKKDLIMPLDTHTFQVGLKLGLLKRKTYDMRAALELTETFRKFDASDQLNMILHSIVWVKRS